MITWKVPITPVNISEKIVSISAIRTETSDSPSADNEAIGQIYTVRMLEADISTSEKKNEALDILWDKYQKQVARQIQIGTVIGNLEEAAENNLEGRE